MEGRDRGKWMKERDKGKGWWKTLEERDVDRHGGKRRRKRRRKGMEELDQGRQGG